jgi:hypothetical protein
VVRRKLGSCGVKLTQGNERRRQKLDIVLAEIAVAFSKFEKQEPKKQNPKHWVKLHKSGIKIILRLPTKQKITF